MIELPYLTEHTPFPPVTEALDDPNGLLAFGGSLTPARLLSAYSKGIFPWFSEGEPLLWWSPDPRAIINLDEFHCSKSLAKLVRRQHYQVTVNRAFDVVIEACATSPRMVRSAGEEAEESSATWITAQMLDAYKALHRFGLAHSVEVWDDSQTLQGGLYGVAVGEIFCGESMFHKAPNTSKLAMYALVKHMQQHQLAFIDCQMPTDHLASLGAVTVSRSEFIARLRQHNQMLDSQGAILSAYRQCWQQQVITP